MPKNKDEGQGMNETLERKADEIIAQPIEKITERSFESPSKNKGDYISKSPYWYVGENGVLVRKDGHINPESVVDTDNEKLLSVRNNLLQVTLAAVEASSAGLEKTGLYVAYIENVLNAWLIDEDTRMAPNLEYAQMRPGEQTGTFYGIIEGDSLMRFIDVTTALEKRNLLSAETGEGVREWFSQYRDWLTVSEKGKQEKAWSNNHATFYALQIAKISEFLGDEGTLTTTLEEVKGLIARQVEEDGSMPEELKRHKGGMGYDYQLFNLYALSRLADIGERHGVELWHHKSEKGSGIEEAFNYFVKNQLVGAGDTPFKKDKTGELYLTFRAAAKAYGNDEYYKLPTRYYPNKLADRLTSSENDLWFF
jgi:hypothetical protein